MRRIDKVLTVAGAAVLACFIVVPFLDLFLSFSGLELNALLLSAAALAVTATIVIVAGVLIVKDKAE